MGICLSHRGTINVIDKIGKNHDESITKIRDQQQLNMNSFDGGYSALTLPGSPAITSPEVSLNEIFDDTLHTDANLMDMMEAFSLMSSPTIPIQSDESDESSCQSPTSDCISLISSVNSSASATDDDTESILPAPEPIPMDRVIARSPSEVNSFVVILDNIDVYVKSFDMRMAHQSKMMNFVNTIAVVDRIDVSHLSSQVTSLDRDSIDLNKFLPTQQDAETMKKHFAIHISRILTEYIPCLQDYSKYITKHIEHRFSKEMAKKSTVVSLGVQLKNENKTEEMVEIMEELHNYVPSCSTKLQYTHPDTAKKEVLNVKQFNHILVGGDQVTVARIRSAHAIRKNSNSTDHRLEGIVPFVQDWHAKLCFMQIVYGRLYKTSSSSEEGTLYQLRNLINRRNVVTDPSRDFNACEDFFLLTFTAHVLCAAMEILGMTKLTDIPNNIPTGNELSKMSPSEKKEKIESVCMKIVEKYSEIDFTQKPDCNPAVHNGLIEYAKEVMTLGLFYSEFQDCIREGDGFRDVRCWKYMLLYCRATGHSNYANEALNLLAQYHFLLPPRLATQLLQSRFINTSGLPGRNIPADLHLEHLNRLCKDSVSNLGANKTPKAIVRVGKSSQSILDIQRNFSTTSGLTKDSGTHTTRSQLEDLMKIMNTLKKVFSGDNIKCHQSFSGLRCNLFQKINQKKFTKWVRQRFAKLLQTSTMNR